MAEETASSRKSARWVIWKPVRGHAAGTGVQLAGDEERQQLVFDGLQRHEAADQVVFVAAEGVAGGVDVVFEHMDRGVCAVGFAQLALGLQG